MYSKNKYSNNLFKSPLLIKNTEKKLEKTLSNFNKLINNPLNSQSPKILSNKKIQNLKKALSTPKTVYNKEFFLFENKNEEDYSNNSLISQVTKYNKINRKLNIKINSLKNLKDFQSNYNKILNQNKTINKIKSDAFREMENRYISKSYRIPKHLYLNNLFSVNPLLMDKIKDIKYYYENKLFEQKRNKKKILVDKAEKFLNHSYEQINDIFLNKISMDDTKEEGFKEVINKRDIFEKECKVNKKDIKKNIIDIKKIMESIQLLENKKLDLKNILNNTPSKKNVHIIKKKENNKLNLNKQIKNKKIIFQNRSHSNIININNKSLKFDNEKQNQNQKMVDMKSKLLKSFIIKDSKKYLKYSKSIEEKLHKSKTPKFFKGNKNNNYFNFIDKSNKIINKCKISDEEKRYNEVETTYYDMKKHLNKTKNFDLNNKLKNFIFKINSDDNNTFSYNTQNIYNNLVNLKKSILDLNLTNILNKIYNNKPSRDMKKIIENEEKMDKTLINFNQSYVKCLLNNKYKSDE